MITDGHITAVIPPGIEKCLMIGDIITGAMSGVVVPGTLPGSITVTFITTGVAVIGAMTMDGDVPAMGGIDPIQRAAATTDATSRAMGGIGPTRKAAAMTDAVSKAMGAIGPTRKAQAMTHAV